MRWDRRGRRHLYAGRLEQDNRKESSNMLFVPADATGERACVCFCRSVLFAGYDVASSAAPKMLVRASDLPASVDASDASTYERTIFKAR